MPDPTIQQALQHAQQTLAASSESSRLDSEILLALVCEKNRTYLRTWPERNLSPEQQTHFQQLIARRARGEPIAYLTGSRAFWDMELRVTPDTLIPRPETERLVELALERIPTDAAWRIADLGTGSGAIALAIARERPRCRVLATDVSIAALAVARDNAQRLDIPNIDFAEGPWCAPLGQPPFQLIVSNPPYVHPADPHLARGDLRFEPSNALQSQPDGLSDLRHIAREAHAHLTSPGWLLLEHGYDQGTAVQALLSTQGYQHICTENDLSGNQRVSVGKWEQTGETLA
ncbi:MAG: peptide chain release factor N(5)-glutamine methyltransferase [Gammaproteobacteria bacterium]|nr:peptide chain release factor N(5)-glutamine methyltransferase [Gammaproteobacteria bacterium]